MLCALLLLSTCPLAGKMEEEAELDGETLTPRDCAAVGEGFLDPLCPLCLLPCGDDEHGAPVSVHCLVVGEVQGKLMICLPAAAWHRTIARRTVPKGFLSKVVAAEVAAAALGDRANEIAGVTVRVWLGFCEGDAEATLLVSDSPPSVCFGTTPAGEVLVPLVEALAELWQNQVASAPVATPLQTASEGESQPLLERLAALERSVSSLTSAMAQARPDASGPPGASAKARSTMHPKRPASAKPAGAAQPDPAGGLCPGLDRGVVAAALAAGVETTALTEMSRMVSSSPLLRLRPEGAKASTQAKQPAPLDESEEEGHEELADTEHQPPPAAVPAESAAGSAEAFAQAMVRCLDTYTGKASSARSTLDRALEAGGGGSLDGSLNGGRRSAAARRALREALVTAPQEISNLIEAAMAEDMSASTPGAGAPQLSSTRGWLEHRSRIQAYPTMVHLTWAIAGALDCIRAGKVQQARARLNIAILMADQVSIDRGSWLLAQELSLEISPPMSSFKKHEAASSAGDPVYSRLLDARWAEVALAKLKEEAEFFDRRQKLSSRLQAPPKDNPEAAPEADKPPRRPPRKPKADA